MYAWVRFRPRLLVWGPSPLALPYSTLTIALDYKKKFKGLQTPLGWEHGRSSIHTQAICCAFSHISLHRTTLKNPVVFYCRCSKSHVSHLKHKMSHEICLEPCGVFGPTDFNWSVDNRGIEALLCIFSPEQLDFSSLPIQRCLSLFTCATILAKYFIKVPTCKKCFQISWKPLTSGIGD